MEIRAPKGSIRLSGSVIASASERWLTIIGVHAMGAKACSRMMDRPRETEGGAPVVRPPTEPAATRLTIRIDFDASRSLGHGKVRLLEQIDRHGSISAAARAMDMSYRRAWLLVEEVSQLFTEPILARQTGGKGGGHARLTVFGRALVQIYRSIQDRSLDVFSSQIDELRARLRPTGESDAEP